MGFVGFLVAVLPATALAIRRPGECLRQLHAVFGGAVLLSAATGLALGAVIWLHLHGALARAGPGYATLLPEFLALGVVLEFAPLAAGFIAAGRSGAGLAAELAGLRLTEQIDALEALGQSPMHALVGPRVLACTVAVPLLTVEVAALAVLGGYGAEWLGGTMSWREYWGACFVRLRVSDIVVSPLKTAVFGYLIGVTATYVGLNARGGTQGIGRAATRGVVYSVLLVVLSDVALVRLVQWLG